MKITHILPLLLSIVCGSTFPNNYNFSPENTVISSDCDDVFMQKKLFLRSIAQLKHVSGDYNKNYFDNKPTLKNKKRNSVNGFTFILLNAGMRKPYLTPYIPWMVEKLEKSRCVIDGTEKIYRYLKDVKGYTIVYATNKDRVSYDAAAQVLGKKFTSLPSKVFVAHPGNSPEFITQLQAFADLPTTAASYKQLLHRAITIQPTETILHAPGKKPDLEYYHYMEQNIGSDKNIIFIDDRKDNIAGFNELKNTTSAQRIGIVFKDPQQLAQEFVTLGILSETDDQKLLEDIRYSGIWEKLNYFTKQTFDKLNRKKVC